MESSASDAATAEAPMAEAAAAAAVAARAAAMAAVALDRGSEEYDRTLSLGKLRVRNGSALWVAQMLP